MALFKISILVGALVPPGKINKTFVSTFIVKPGPEVIKLFSCSTQHKISTAHKN